MTLGQSIRTRGVSAIIACIIALFAAMSAPTGAHASDISFVNPRSAFQQGIAAYRAGRYTLAEQALRFAAESGNRRAEIELSDVLADEDNPRRDMGRAYDIIAKLSQNFARADLRSRRTRRLYSRVATQYALMHLHGVPERNIDPNIDFARDNLEFAASRLQSKKAQFELQKLYLTGALGEANLRRGLQWLDRSAQRRYPPAMALLAEKLWRGDQVRQNRARALRLVRDALQLIGPRDRIWVEDLFQEIYCATKPAERARIAGYARDAGAQGVIPLERRGEISIPRSCADANATETADRTPQNWEVWRSLESGDAVNEQKERREGQGAVPFTAERPARRRAPAFDYDYGGSGAPSGFSFN